MEDKAWEYINKAWACFTVVDPQNNLKEPTSPQQIEESKPWLEKARAENPTNQQTIALIEELERFYPIWETRHFDGSKGVIVGAIIMGVVLSMVMFPIVRAAMAGENVAGGFFKIFLNMGIIFLWFIGGTIAYYYASKAPRWLVDKRNSGLRLGKAAGRIGWGIIGSLANSDRTYRVTRSDGSSYTEHDNTGSTMAFALTIVYFSFNVAIVPFRALLNYLRNYVWYK